MSSSNLTSGRLRFSNPEEAHEYYLANGLTDGLPIVPPTEERVRSMLDYAHLAPDEVVATEPVRQKQFTAEKIAVNAVMAGCKPEYFPVVVAAVSACCEGPLNLHASSTSTNGVTVLVLVSGPYAREIGMNSGAVMMGNGNRANATIGRAVNLVKSNFYGSKPQDMDKSTFGHPGKYTFCFAENMENSPWPSLAEAKGFGPTASTVTVFAANGPLQVSIYGGKEPESFLLGAAHAMMALGPSNPEVLVVVSPELMAYIAEAGWSREQVQELLCERSRLPTQEWLAGQRVDRPEMIQDSDELLGCVPDADRITVVPGGGAAGGFINLIASWGASRSVTREIQLGR